MSTCPFLIYKIHCSLFLDLNFRALPNNLHDEFNRLKKFIFSELKEVQTDDTFVIYWDVKYPFPLSNRDVSFHDETVERYKLRVKIKDL